MNISDTHQIGDLRISKITEQVFSALSVARLYPDATPQMLGAISSGGQITQDTPVEMSIHSWLVETPQHRLLIDTASGNFKDRPFNSIFHQLQSPWLNNLEQTGMRPDDINFV